MPAWAGLLLGPGCLRGRAGLLGAGRPGSRLARRLTGLRVCARSGRASGLSDGRSLLVLEVGEGADYWPSQRSTWARKAGSVKEEVQPIPAFSSWLGPGWGR